MKKIKLSEYDKSMGTLIDVQSPIDYQNSKINGSINIYADKLILNHNKYLNKNEAYYIVCLKGHLSKRVVQVLSYYGYNVTQVLR